MRAEGDCRGPKLRACQEVGGHGPHHAVVPVILDEKEAGDPGPGSWP